METTQTEELLTPDFLRKIERLSLVARRLFAGRTRGERRSTRRGASVEFADYRSYTVGDDLRRVDWNVYARLEKLFLKLFVEEEDLHVYILIDASRSMAFGDPTKFLYARRVAAALAYMALSSLDRVGLAALRGDSSALLSPRRGRQAAFGVFDWLRSLEASGGVHLASALRDFSLRTSQPGLAIVISDLFDPDYQQGLSALLARGFEVTLIHVLDVEEENPTLVGDLMLVDSETGERREVTITQTLLRRYAARFADFRAEIDRFCARRGCALVRVNNRTPFEDLVLRSLRMRGIAR